MDLVPTEGPADRSSPKEHWLCLRGAIAPTPTVIVRARRPASRGPTGRRRGCFQKQSSPHIRRVQHAALSVAGLKGTMSEAELHVMQARMRGGLLSKAQRGELQVPLPVGFLYDAQGQAMLDPDQQVQQSIRFLFESFRRLGSAGAVVKAFREGKLLFPHRPRGGPQDGELVWVKLSITQTLFVLHNS